MRVSGRKLGLIGAVAVAAITAASLFANAQQSPATQPDTLILAGKLLADPASGEVLTQQSILVRNGRIVSITAGYAKPANGAKVVDLKNAFVLPGLIDSHVHLTSETGPDSRLDEFIKTSADQAIDGAGFALTTLEAGFTTVADLGGDARSGPRPARRHRPRRHPRPAHHRFRRRGQRSWRTRRRQRHAACDGRKSCARTRVCSGADDCARAVRERVRDGADIIKITATGGVLSQTGGRPRPAVHRRRTGIDRRRPPTRMGRKVTAHAHGVDGINSFLRAGGDSIEHGTYRRRGIRAALQGAWRVSRAHAAGRRFRRARGGKARTASSRPPSRRRPSRPDPRCSTCSAACTRPA